MYVVLQVVKEMILADLVKYGKIEKLMSYEQVFVWLIHIQARYSCFSYGTIGIHKGEEDSLA